jgi:DnaK suppressor protein
MEKTTLIASVDALGKNNEYMSAEHYNLFGAHIRQQLSEMLNTRSKAKSDFAGSERNAADPIDKASLDAEKETHLRREANLTMNIKKAESALRAIGNEEYGFCSSCGGDIGLVRLLAAPFALRDMECERANEIKAKQLTGVNIKVY